MKNNEKQTSLYGNVVVDKDHPRIILRGALDHLQALILKAQVVLEDRGLENEVQSLEEFLTYTRTILQAEALNQPFAEQPLLGLNSEELREESYRICQFFPSKTMKLPHFTQKLASIELNFLRSATRQVEIMAVTAYKSNYPIDLSIITALNRLSSAFYIVAREQASLLP